MAQVSLYIEDEVMAGVKADAKTEGISVSKYVTRALAQRNAGKKITAAWLEGVYGSMADADWLVVPEEAPGRLRDIPALG